MLLAGGSHGCKVCCLRVVSLELGRRMRGLRGQKIPPDVSLNPLLYSK